MVTVPVSGTGSCSFWDQVTVPGSRHLYVLHDFHDKRGFARTFDKEGGKVTTRDGGGGFGGGVVTQVTVCVLLVKGSTHVLHIKSRVSPCHIKSCNCNSSIMLKFCLFILHISGEHDKKLHRAP